MARAGGWLWVLPDGERVDEAMVAAAKARGFVDGSRYLSFGQLVDALAAERGHRRCSPLTARVVVWAVAQELGHGTFGSFVQEPAFARAALELVFELKSGGVGPGAFAQAADGFPPARRERARYLAQLYQDYQAKLAELELSDREDAVRLATERLGSAGLPEAWQGLTGISIGGLFDFPVLRRELVLALAQACDRAGVQLRLELPGAGTAELDGVVDPLFADLERRAQSLGTLEVSKQDYPALGRPLARLGARLFGAGVETGAVPHGALRLLRAATPRDEVRHLVSLCREQVARGIPPEKLAIAFPEIGEEAEWAQAALQALGIPARARRGAPLMSTAVGRLALELPLLPDDGFPADAVARLLSSRYLPELSGGAPDAPASLLARASVRDDRLGAEGERGAYEVRLGALARRLALRSSSARLAQVEALAERCQRLIARAGKIPAQGRMGELLTRWWSALEALGLPRAVRQPEPRDAEGTAFGRAVLGALARDQAAFEALTAMKAKLSLALEQAGAKRTRIPRRTFHRWLLDAAADYNLPARGHKGGAVQILDLRDLVGRTFEHVCLGGLVDGRFPGREPPHPLFPDEDRARINAALKRDVFRLAAGEGGARTPWRLASDRLLLFLGLCAAKGTVSVSYAAHAASGAEQTPSPFLDELVRQSGQRPESRPLQAVVSLDEVQTEQELRARVALERFAPIALRSSEPDPAAKALCQTLEGEPWLERTAHLVAIEEERLRFFTDPEHPGGPFTGNLAAEGLEEALARCFEFGRVRPLSASLLHKLGNCAFQGFLAFGLGLEEPEAPGEEIDPRGQGSFWHKVLEELFPRLKANDLLGALADDVPDALLDEALERAAKEAERSGHVGHRALWQLGRERARRMVRRVLASSARGLPFHFLEPVRTELRFGRPDAPEAWREVAVPGLAGAPPIYVEGKIDRVDEGQGGLGVVDYKSSGSRSLKQSVEQLLVTEFQLPLYLHAARLAGHPGALKAAWLSLKDGEPVHLEEELVRRGISLEQLLATDADTRLELLADERPNLANALHRLVAQLRAGRFPARPQDCAYCPYRAVCRISERRFPEAA
jgi:ATP-dependent helicase/nuclease subunit B